MATTTKSIGADGRLSIIVTLVSQDADNNRSVVRIRGIIYNDNGSRSFNNSGTSVTLSGTNSYSTSVPIDVAGYSSQEILDRQYTVTHDSNGYRTVSYTLKLGSTGTYTFGSGGSVSESLTLPRIAQVPDAPGTPSRTFSPPNKITLSWSAAANNGAPILEYQVQWSRSSTYTGSSSQSAGTARTDVVTTAYIGDTTYFRVRARNSRGWGPYSPSTTYAIPDVPGTPGVPSLAYTPATTMAVSWSAPTNGGATITGYDIQYATDAAFTNPKMISTPTTSGVINDLTVGSTWYFRVRAKNSQGVGAWSAASSYLVVCGPRVLHEGVWRNTIAYVNNNGTWKLAIPYVNANGVWKVAGG